MALRTTTSSSNRRLAPTSHAVAGTGSNHERPNSKANARWCRLRLYRELVGVFVTMSSKIQVVLPAKAIPDGSVVTKVTGKAKYILRQEVEIHGRGDDEAAEKIRSITDHRKIYFSNCVMLVGVSSGNIHVVPDALELMWHTEYYTLLQFLTRDTE